MEEREERKIYEKECREYLRAWGFSTIREIYEPDEETLRCIADKHDWELWGGAETDFNAIKFRCKTCGHVQSVAYPEKWFEE